MHSVATEDQTKPSRARRSPNLWVILGWVRLRRLYEEVTLFDIVRLSEYTTWFPTSCDDLPHWVEIS